jgi:hypothetical protein
MINNIFHLQDEPIQCILQGMYCNILQFIYIRIGVQLILPGTTSTHICTYHAVLLYVQYIAEYGSDKNARKWRQHFCRRI